MWEDKILTAMGNAASNLLREPLAFSADIIRNHTPTEVRMALESLRKGFAWRSGLHAYREHLKEKEFAIHFFGVQPSRVQIDEFYIEMEICPQQISFYRCKGRRPSNFLLEEKAGEQPRYYILGNAGAGKTSLLKFLGWKSIEGEKENYFPFFIKLHELAEALEQPRKEATQSDEEVFGDFLARQIKGWIVKGASGNVEPDLSLHIWIEALLRSGRALLLLDGLDEVPSRKARQRVGRLVRSISLDYPYTRIVISSRLPPSPLAGFERYLIAPLQEEQISNYVHKWFDKFGGGEKQENKRSTSFLAELDKDRAFQELAQTPLLLNLLCLTFDTFHELSPRRVELYRQATEALLTLWRTTRGVPQPEDLPNRSLPLDLKEALFKEVAYQGLRQRYVELPRSAILPILQKALQSWYPKDFTMDGPLAEAAEKLLKNLERNYGLLIQVESGRYVFLHRGFQEFYAAAYLKERGSTLWNELFQHLGEDSAWDATFANLVQMMAYSESTEELFTFLQGEWHNWAEVRRIQAALRAAFRPLKATGLQALQAWQAYLTAEAWRLTEVLQILGTLSHSQGEATRDLMTQFAFLWPNQKSARPIWANTLTPGGQEEIMEIVERGLETVETGRGALGTLLATYQEYHGGWRQPEGQSWLEERLQVAQAEWERHRTLPETLWPFLLEEAAFDDLEEFLKKVYPILEGLLYARLTPERREKFWRFFLLEG